MVGGQGAEKAESLCLVWHRLEKCLIGRQNDEPRRLEKT